MDPARSRSFWSRAFNATVLQPWLPMSPRARPEQHRLEMAAAVRGVVGMVAEHVESGAVAAPAPAGIAHTPCAGGRPAPAHCAGGRPAPIVEVCWSR